MFGSIDLKVRPIRLAFLVNPNNTSSIREAIQISSSLWGGSYNPIVPVYKRMPSSWSDKPFRAPKAEKVVKGYLDAFDPDVLVDCTVAVPEYVKQLGLRIIKRQEVWEPFTKNNFPPKFGVGIFELLEQVFEEHFRYTERFPIKVVIPDIPKTHSLFWASLFGELPANVLSVVHQNYTEALAIESTTAGTSNIGNLLRMDILFPRRITQYSLDVFSRSGFRRDACVFYMDANQNADVIDYWNLRALGKAVICVPKQLQEDEEIRKLVINFLKSVRKPLKNNPEIYEYASIIRSRHVSMEEMQSFAHSLNIKKEANDESNEPFFVLQHWYPRIWDEWARDKDGAEPVDVFGEQKSLQFNDVGRRVQFTAIRPSFISNYAAHGEHRVANEISFRFYGFDEALAEVIPQNSGDNVRRAISSLASFRRDWRVGRNGLVKLIGFNHAEHWDVPSGQDVFFAWLRDLGWNPRLSTPGVITKEIFNHLEGSVRVLANESLLKLLEHMNGGPVNERELPVGEIKTRLKKISPQGNLHDYLVSRNVFRIGVKVQCPSCTRNTWHSLEDIKEQITCPKCLKSYPAIGNIENGIWSYKTAGPFSIPGYADGGYCVLLSLDFFSDYRLHSIKITPCFSFEAENNKDGKMEADFALLWQEASFKGVAEGSLFAECKTFGTFEKKDFRRMASIAKSFPGAVLAFCTLRATLTKDEIEEITRIAKRGRRYWKNERPINPVLILTGREILGEWGPPECWEALGLSKKFENVYTLLDVCNATQQIYLGLPSWHEYWHQEFERKRQRRSNKQN